MRDSPYAGILPPVLKWIRETLDAYDRQKRSVESFGFRRLPLYFHASLLRATKVVVTDCPPVPYQDTYFVETGAASSESLHFHELIHAIQWRVLGREDFLLMYAAGLAEHGYRNSPLEAMAYEHEARFENGAPPYSVEAEVGSRTLELLPGS
jgi:hypothetical protein